VFSFSLALAGLSHLDAKRYGRAALLLGLSATQNPLLVLLAGVPVVAAGGSGVEAGRARRGGAAVALVPYAFYFVTFGKPSLITADYTNPANIGLGRTASLLFDLTRGCCVCAGALLAAFAGRWV